MPKQDHTLPKRLGSAGTKGSTAAERLSAQQSALIHLLAEDLLKVTNAQAKRLLEHGVTREPRAAFSEPLKPAA